MLLDTSRRARRRLVIVGAHGFGRELLWTAEAMDPASHDWAFAGFLDDDPDLARARFAAAGVPHPVLGATADWQPAGDEVFVCAERVPRAKLAMCLLLRERGARFATLLHPRAELHAGVVHGEGLVVRQFAGPSPGCVIGDFVTINSSTGVAHDCVVGDGCTLEAHADLLGGARLGRGVHVGSHAIVHPGATVGDFAVVGTGTVVLRRVAAEATVFGHPARVLPFADGQRAWAHPPVATSTR